LHIFKYGNTLGYIAGNMNDTFYNNVKMTLRFGRCVSVFCWNLLPACWWTWRQRVKVPLKQWYTHIP